MHAPLRRYLFAAAVLAALVPTTARAGGINNRFDILHLRPFIGYEISRVGSIQVLLPDGSYYKTDTFHASGLAWGGYLGFRLGLISLDALFQRTELALTNDGRAVQMNKLYLDLGFNFGTSWLRSVLDLGFGYSWLDLEGVAPRQGFGGRIGLSLDFYPAQWFSVGPTAAFDAQGYSIHNGYTGAFGGTFAIRIGFHL
jgi:hypothetical protein